MKTLYDDLGIPKNATEDQIKQAYREKAKQNHPDVGGDTEKMAEITNAYMILSVKIKRDRYDATGETKETPFEAKFASFVGQVFLQVIEASKDIATTDLIKEFRIAVNNIIDQSIGSRTETEKKLKKFKEVKRRLKVKDDNTIGIVIDNQIEMNENTLALLKEEVEFLKKCKLIIASYGYDFDKIEEVQKQYQSNYVVNGMYSDEDKDSPEEMRKSLNDFLRKYTRG